MNYIQWRNDIFGESPESDPVTNDLLQETYSVPKTKAFDYIDQALKDPEIHDLFSKEQIGNGLQVIYDNGCSDFPFCYTQAGDEARRIEGILNLKKLYDNFFDRYCEGPVTNIGNDQYDGKMGYLCYMFWDIFILYSGNASPDMIAAGLEVMKHGLYMKNDNCIVSAIHGLGHWVFDTPQAAKILKQWLKRPTTRNAVVRTYAKHASTGMIQ